MSQSSRSGLSVPMSYKGDCFHIQRLSWGMRNATDFRWCTFGRSRLAEQIAQQLAQPVVYVATAQALDGEMQARIQHHQQQRPEDWGLCEKPIYLAAAVGQIRSSKPNHFGRLPDLMDE